MFKPADLEDSIRLVSALAAGVLAGLGLALRGWPWHQWLPAAILTFAIVTVLWVLAWYIRRKLTYQTMAARTKASLRAGGDGWPDHRADRAQ